MRTAYLLWPVLGLLVCVRVASAHSAAVHDSKLDCRSFQVRIRAKDSGFQIREVRSHSPALAWWGCDGSETTLVSKAKISGRTIHLSWRLDHVRSEGHTLDLIYRCPSQRLEARSAWTSTSGDAPFEQTLSITNHGTSAVTIPLQSSLVWGTSTAGRGELEELWVEKAAGRPSPFGVHRDPISPGYTHTVLSEPYESDKRAYSRDWRDRDAVPWLAAYDPRTRSGFYAGVEFSGRVALKLVRDSGSHLQVTLGLASEDNPAKPLEAVIQPGETYALPTVFVGFFQGSVDDGSNQLRHWVDRYLRPPAFDPRYPLLNLDSWGSDMAISSDVTHRMMLEAAKIDIEQFQADAGWYRSVGDWRPNPTKFPAGIAAVADEAHSLGLKFGLWVGWTQGGNSPDAEDPSHILNVHSPERSDWFTQDYPSTWKPSDYVGANLCLADTQAVGWCDRLLTQIVKDCHLDMLEHDQQMMVEDCARTDHGHTASRGDIAYRSALGYYRVYDDIRKKYPRLLFENCVNGGRNVDFGAARRAHYFSIVDSYDPLSNREAIYDITYVMPPAMCECYVQKMPVKTLDEFRSMLRSGLMGWFSLMQDPSTWTPDQQAAAKQEFARYKRVLRPLIRNGNVFHVSARPDGVRWDGMEYAAADATQAVIFAFKGSTSVDRHIYRVQGLHAKSLYQVRFVDGGQTDYTANGLDLMSEGITVKLTSKGTSQLVLLSALDK